MKKIHLSEKQILLLLFFFLWIYACLRAILIPVAHDEVATFFYYVHTGKFLPFNSHWDTNNHFLNSLLTWISYRVFGSSLFALRLPNLLFMPLFFFYCYKIASEIRHPFLRWTFLLSLCLAHSFVEFFGISRGYGISMALLFGSAWYLMCFIKTNRTVYITPCLLFIMLGTYSNLALVNTYFIIVFLIFIYAVGNDKRFAGKDRKVLVPLFVFGVLPILFFGLILIRMKLQGGLWAGSANGLWNATVKTLIRLIMNSDPAIFGYFVVFYFILSCALFIILVIRRWQEKFFQHSSMVFFYLLAGNLIAVTILGYVFKINWPEDRIALYFFPFFVGTIVFLVDQPKALKKAHLNILLVIPLLFLPVQFFLRLNLTNLSFYISDNIPHRFYDKVYADWIPGKLPPTIGGYKGRHFCWSYLDFRNGGKVSNVYSSTYPGYETDFQIVDVKENPDWLNYYDSIDYDKYSGRHLLKRKIPLAKVFISASPPFGTKGKISPDFFLFCQAKVDTLAGKTLFVTYDMTIESDVKPFVAWIVATVSDSSGNNLLYERIPLDWLRTEWKGSNSHFVNVMFLSDLPPAAFRLDTYIWNMEHAPFTIRNGKVSIFRLIPDWK
jgi:hypothetical protein